ncbi:MAG TPA: septum formation initiator family protein [Acidimicrobiales bacterium]|nr:septum formation initiator family protein [Acidimicrobiales bacterium]
MRLGPRKRVVAEEERRVGPAVAASRRAHPTARASVSRWPGSNAGALPPDFPGGGRDDVRLLLVADPPPSTERAKNAKAKDPKARRSLPIRPPQSFNNVVAAVYAALADPLAADSAEAREQRAARVREVGLIAASTALVALLVYGIFPVRTFLNQRAATSDAEERLERIAEANDRLTGEVEQLQDDDEIELRARSDYGWVFPGEESYGVLPSPLATTTTTAPEAADADENDD